MKRFDAAIAATAMVVLMAVSIPAGAAPPTVTPSPGYDARLQEQRAAQTVVEPAAPGPPPAAPRKSKRKSSH